MFEQAKAFQFIISEQVKFLNIFDNPITISEGTKPKNKFLRKMQSLEIAGDEQRNFEFSQGKKKSNSKAGMAAPPPKIEDIVRNLHPVSTLSNGTRSILVSTATPGMSPPDNHTITKFKKQIHAGKKSYKSDGQFVRVSRMKGSIEQVTTPNTNSEQKIRMKIEANHSQQNLATILNGSNQQTSKQINTKDQKEMQINFKVSPFASPYLSPWAATILREQFHVDLKIKEQYGTKHWVAKRFKSNESSEEYEQQQIKNAQGKIQSRRDLKRENESSQLKHYEKLHLQPIIIKKPATAAKFINRKKIINYEASESEINPNFVNSNYMGFR